MPEESPYYINPYRSGRQYPIMGSVRAGGPYKIPYDPMANNPGIMAMEAYRQAKENRRKQQRDEAAYAAQIAELQGSYTPELQEKVLAPMAEEPGLGNQLVGGLRRMFGSDTQQGYARPFTVPQGLRTKYEQDIEKETRASNLKQRLEDMKYLRSLDLEGLKHEYNLEGRELTGSLDRQNREFTAKSQKELADIREKGADRRLREREAGEDRRKKMGDDSAGTKIGGTLESIRQKIAAGTPLTEGEQSLYDQSINEEKKPLTEQEKSEKATQIFADMQAGIANAASAADKWWPRANDPIEQHFSPMLDLYMNELADIGYELYQREDGQYSVRKAAGGKAPAPKTAQKDNRTPLDEIL